MVEAEIEIYRKLQKHLDEMPVGYPATKSGVELRILQHLFTPEEAQIAIQLKFLPEPLNRIYKKFRKTSMSINALEKKLDEMYGKGTINFGVKKEGNQDVKYYANAYLVIGMFEYQLNQLTKEFVKDIKQYFKEAFFEKEFNRTNIPQLRTIPIEESLEYQQTISTYDDLKTIIEKSKEQIGLAECICKKAKDLLGDPCKKTDLREVCFSFGRAAEFYIEKGLGRAINKKEAWEILKKVEEAGLVIQPGNSQRPMCICCCCGCCCEILINQKRLAEPAQFFATNYYAKVDEDSCSGCGICEDRCNMDAVKVEDNVAKVNKMRCIGCGACVSTCTSEAIKLVKKENEIVPPINTAATYKAIMDKKAELARIEKSY